MDYEQDCDFCQIIRGEQEARIVCRMPGAVAFFPLNPAALGHTLVVPRQHIPDIWTLSDDQAAPLIHAVLRVVRAVAKALNPDGLNVINSAGEAASQTVCHLHVHVVPRWSSDHIGNIWPPSEPWSEDIKDDVLDSLQQACGQGNPS